MAWIRMIAKGEADETLRAIYEGIGAGGKVDNILKIHSLHPESLRTHYELYRDLMYGPGPLSRTEREMIAVVVSKANACHY